MTGRRVNKKIFRFQNQKGGSIMQHINLINNCIELLEVIINNITNNNY